VLIAVAIGAVSTAAPLIREAEAPALAIAFWRNALAVAVLGPLCALRRREEIAGLAAAPGPAGGAVLAGVLLSAHFAFWVPSLSFTTVASSVALVATQPVWAALLARARGQQVPAQAWLGIVVAVGGDHFTNDLAVGLRTPIPEAERIKRHYGCAAAAFLHEDAAIEIASVGDRPPRTIFARMLTEIIEPRAQELQRLHGGRVVGREQLQLRTEDRVDLVRPLVARPRLDDRELTRMPERDVDRSVAAFGKPGDRATARGRDRPVARVDRA